jgi:hypothetical protein
MEMHFPNFIDVSKKIFRDKEKIINFLRIKLMKFKK